MKYSWQEKTAPPSHADDWLITYADMITLLLCFFAIFFIVSITKKDSTQKAPLPAHAIEQEIPSAPQREAPPSDVPVPDAFQNDLPFHKLGPDDFAAATPAVEAADETPTEQRSSPDPAALEAPAVKAEARPTPPSAAPSPALAPQIAAPATAAGNADFEQKGDRITTLEINSAAFFGSGSASVSAAGKTILQNVAINLKGDQFKDYIITVEGHTDDTPIDTAQFPSNWELSTARAAAVVHFLLDQGLSASKLRAVGYADTLPKVPNRDANGNPLPGNQLQNRRVVIKLEKIDKGQ